MMNNLKRTKYIVIVMLLIIVSLSCHTYYKTVPAAASNQQQAARSIDSLNQLNRYFVLRNGNVAYSMGRVQISEDRKTMSCMLEFLPFDHSLHLVNGLKGKRQYKTTRLEGLKLLSEVHFFTPYDSSVRQGTYVLQLDKVQKIEIIQHDRKRTTNSYVIGAVGYTLGAAALVVIIAAALKSSCPFVSAYDGKEFSLQGEIFGGAIYPQLARNDFIPLQMAESAKGDLQIKISNELHERQYTDLASLWVVTHDKGSRVLADEQGRLYSIADPQAPVRATLNETKDILPSLMVSGDDHLLYMDDSSRTDARNDATLSFRKPSNATRGKLLLSLKNSYWLDLLYGEVAKGFGTYYATYISEQKKKPAEELLKWVREQQIPLEVSVRTSAGWKTVASITTIGPVARRDMIVALDLPAHEEIIEVKLSSGFMFWEIDQAAMDFTPDEAIHVEKLAPAYATDEKGNSVLATLQKDDGLYLEQPDIGNVAIIGFKSTIPKESGYSRTYILHAKGYYEHVRDFKNKPDPNFLAQFRKPGAFPRYGMNLYGKVQEKALTSFATNVH